MEKSPRIVYLETSLSNALSAQTELKTQLTDLKRSLARITNQRDLYQSQLAEKTFLLQNQTQKVKQLTRSNDYLASRIKQLSTSSNKTNRYASIRDTPHRRKLMAAVQEFLYPKELPAHQLTPAPRLYNEFLASDAYKYTRSPTDPTPSPTLFIKQLLELGYTKRRMRNPDTPPHSRIQTHCWGIYPALPSIDDTTHTSNPTEDTL